MKTNDLLNASSLPSKRIPEPYLRAEIAAFPLASEESFRSALLELDPQLGENNRTRNLWRACENQFAPHTGWSLDRLVSSRDRGWFGLQSDYEPVPVPMHRYLRSLAGSHLVARGGVTEIEESTELSALDATAHYRWLTITLPEDLLLSALGVEPPPMSVDIDPPLLVRHLLDSGVAEIHQHIGAGMNFPLLWVSALAAIASPDVGENELESPGAPLSNGKFLVRWLLAAAVARCALAEHLIRGGNDFNSFLKMEFLDNYQKPQYNSAWTSMIRGVNDFKSILMELQNKHPKLQHDVDNFKIILERFQEKYLVAQHDSTWTTIIRSVSDLKSTLQEFQDKYPEELQDDVFNFKTILQEFLDKNPERKNHPAWTPRRREMLVAVLDALATGDNERLPDIEPLRDLYADIHPTALKLGDNPIKSVEDAFRRCDPIAVRLDLHGENVGERWLLRQSLAYLDKGDEGSGDQYDEHFARIFWQTVRIRCQYYRAVVERPLTGGLQWFIRFYDRVGKLRAPLNPILPEISYQVAGERHRIKALELRTSMGNTAIEIGECALNYVQSWQQVLKKTSGSMFEPEMGIIFHFVKSRDSDKAWPEGVPAAFWAGTHSEPYKAYNKEHGTDVQHGRYVGYFADQCCKARALAELIQAVPSSLWLIRGLDVASDELGIPTWVLAPLFRHILDEAAKVSILEDAGPPLRVTAHVGEDFRHLLEGMRRIYEQVHYILGNTPGRLGHAVALGVDPQTWAESVGSILMPAEDRLWDLVWEWRLYSKYRIKPEYAAAAPAGRVDVLLNQVRELSDLVYGKPGYRVEELAEAHHMLHRFLVPPFVKKPMVDGGFDTFLSGARNIKAWSGHERRVHAQRRVGKILETYFDDESVFRRGQTLIDVPVCMDEVAALNAVQHGLRRGIAQSGIVVEINPSSNLLIGDLLDLRNHPILRLFQPVPEPGDPPPVMIALGSDDPLTFSTQLLREYTLLHQAASAAGYSERVVQDWLETIRSTGMDARFTRAWKPCAEKMAESLVRDLSEYLYLPRNPA